MLRGEKAGAMALRSLRWASPSLRISVWAWNARAIGVRGSSELNSSQFSLTYLVSAALVRRIRLMLGTRRTGASARRRLKIG